MALRTDIKPVAENDPIDLQEQRATSHNPDMSSAVLDLRPQKPNHDADKDNFFFEYLPATAMHMPAANFEHIKNLASDQVTKTANFVRRHPRYFIAGLLVLAALLLFSLSAMTHRTVSRTNPDTSAPAAITTTSNQTPATSGANGSSSESPTAADPAPASSPATSAPTTQPSAASQAPSQTQPSSQPPAQPAPSQDSTSQSGTINICLPSDLAANACISF